MPEYTRKSPAPDAFSTAQALENVGGVAFTM
jgi:hypothetical protein